MQHFYTFVYFVHFKYFLTKFMISHPTISFPLLSCRVLFIYLFIYSASPINYMYMKTTNQNSHTYTEERKKTLYGRDTTTAFANSLPL